MISFLASVWNVLLPGLPTLLGVVIGGIITYFTTRGIETQRWNQQKKDRRKQDEREALKHAMDWLRPIDEATITAFVNAASYSDQIDLINKQHLEPEPKWPDLYAKLMKLRIHPSLEYLLPSNVREAAIPIYFALREVQSAVAETRAAENAIIDSRRDAGNAPLSYEQEGHLRGLKLGLASKVNHLLELAGNFRKSLEAEYQATYK